MGKEILDKIDEAIDRRNKIFNDAMKKIHSHAEMKQWNDVKKQMNALIKKLDQYS